MIEYFQNEVQVPLMGSSLLTGLQQESFFKRYRGDYISKQVGSKIVIFKSVALKSFKRQVTEKQMVALSSKKFTGVVSSKTYRKIIQTCQNWADTLVMLNMQNNVSKGKDFRQIVLLTLTLSGEQKDDDRVIKRKLLMPFLTHLIRLKRDVNYLWKAEAQKNGNIHFHILLDRFYDKDDLRYEWNKLQSNLGYHKEAITQANNWGSPSTRVESLRDKGNAIAYVAKYFSKNTADRPIEGRLWGCNRNLGELKPLEAKLKKNDAIALVNDMCWNSNCIHCEENYVILSQIKKDSLIKYMEPDNYRWNTAITWNTELLRTMDFSPQAALEKTEWYYDTCKEFGEVTASYLSNNNFMFQGELFPPKS